MNNIYPLEVVGRGSKTQRQVGENLKYITCCNLSHYSTISSLLWELLWPRGSVLHLKPPGRQCHLIHLTTLERLSMTPFNLYVD